MVTYGQFVIGPAGCGKSTYCSLMEKHYEVCHRPVHIVNLDPAAEQFDYKVDIDIRELVHVDDVMDDETLRLGPNGALIFSINFLLDHFDWLENQLCDDFYYIFDCPGQIELYTHVPVMKRLMGKLVELNFNLCSVFLLDSQFLTDSSKFIFGILSSLSAMMMLSIPHLTVLTKIDLISASDRERMEKFIVPELWPSFEFSDSIDYRGLLSRLSSVVSDFGMVQLMMLDVADEESVIDVATKVDLVLQCDDYAEGRVMDFDL